MKRWQVIVLGIAVVLLLAVRGIYLKINRGKDEKRWYVSQLNFDFSGRVDSVQRFRNHRGGIIFFAFTRGNPDRSTEHKLRKKIKHNGEIRLMWEAAGRNAFFFQDVARIQAGDSLVLNSSSNQTKFFRDGKLVIEAWVHDSLVGRPF